MKLQAPAEHARASTRHVGVPDEATPYNFRHHFASRLIAAGANVADVQKLLGHSSVAVTTKVYWHANTDALAEVYARFAGGVRSSGWCRRSRDQV